MSNSVFKTVVTIATLFFFSCSKEDSKIAEVDFGESEFYKPFLWQSKEVDTLTKTLILDFNAAAAGASSYVILELELEKPKHISRNDFELLVNGEKQKDFRIRLNAQNYSSSNEVKISLVFKSSAKDRRYKGYLRVVDHGDIDIVNHSTASNNPAVLQWEADFDRKMNPLLKIIIVILIITGIILFIWFAIIQKILYPKFKGGQILISYQNNEPKRVDLSGKIGCYLGKSKKPSGFIKFFCGKHAFCLEDRDWTLYIKPVGISEHRDRSHKTKKLAKLILQKNIFQFQKIYPERIKVYGKEVFYHESKYQINSDTIIEYLNIRHQRLQES